MGVDCQILIHRANSGVFRPGQPVVGTVKYFINKPTNFKTIDVSFVGKATCQWSVSGPDTSTMVYCNEEDYVNENKNLFKAKYGQEVLLLGNFEHPFDFLLPDNIPSSIKSNSGGKIEYNVVVSFVKGKGLRTLKEYTRGIPVYGYVSPCSPEPLTFGLQKKLLALRTNYIIDVKAQIDKTFLTPGENIKLKLTINNETPVPFTIITELIEYFTSVAEDKTTKVASKPLETTKSTANIVEKCVSVINCIVPTLPSLYSIQHSKILFGEYRVKVTARLPFPYNNANVEVPVVIGERRDQVGTAAADDDDGNSSSLDTPEVPVGNLIEL